MQIHYAARRGDREAVRRQLTRGVRVDVPDEHEGETPLMWAARGRRADAAFLRFLVEQGADVNAASADTTPLLNAARAGSLEKVRFLVSAGADVHFRSPNNYSVLTTGTPPALEVTRLLLESGAEPDGVTPWSESALSVASRESAWPTVRLLLEFGADPAPLEWTPLMRAAALGSPEDLEAALLPGADLGAWDRWERTPWLLAVCAGDIAKAETLKALGSDTSAAGRGGNMALMYAAKRNDVPMLAWLLSQGANVNAATGFGDTALHEAASYGSADACRVLLAAGADALAENQVKSQPISQAATVEVVRVLVEAGADIDFVDGSGDWPLKQAAGEDDPKKVRALLALGASVETASSGGTALHEAVQDDALDVMRILLEAGADPNTQDTDLWGPLWYTRTMEAVQMLLNAGADVHLVDEMGREALENHTDTEVQALLIAAGCSVNPPDTTYGTPLIAASGSGRLEQVRFLLSHGADVGAATSWGKTALMEAAERGFAAGVRALLEAGADAGARDEEGRTALVYAAAPESADTYQSFLKTKRRSEQGYLDSLPDFVDRALLQQAEEIGGPWRPNPADYGYVASDSLECLELLARAGADLNARDALGRTPLMHTAAWGRSVRVAGLLALGADAALRDTDGRTADDHAASHPDGEQRAAVRLLLAGAARPKG